MLRGLGEGPSSQIVLWNVGRSSFRKAWLVMAGSTHIFSEPRGFGAVFYMGQVQISYAGVCACCPANTLFSRDASPMEVVQHSCSKR